jgi:hypothetical protein
MQITERTQTNSEDQLPDYRITRITLTLPDCSEGIESSDVRASLLLRGWPFSLMLQS